MNTHRVAGLIAIVFALTSGGLRPPLAQAQEKEFAAAEKTDLLDR